MGAGAPIHQMARAFGVYDEKRGSYKRVTFIIGTDGYIQHVIDDSSDMERHSREALEFIQSLP
jgi:peroxiredoxin